nr:MAG TPA: hypothetical protein [Caudoviricetes sp.]DAT57252.1 MAG TPA: hypothetical protein [Caudoviricetes sp.]
MKVYFQNSPKNTVKWKRRGIFSALSSFSTATQRTAEPPFS